MSTTGISKATLDYTGLGSGGWGVGAEEDLLEVYHLEEWTKLLHRFSSSSCRLHTDNTVFGGRRLSLIHI